eukprot:1951507-Pyramimonas_sp.AAC.1
MGDGRPEEGQRKEVSMEDRGMGSSTAGSDQHARSACPSPRYAPILKGLPSRVLGGRARAPLAVRSASGHSPGCARFLDGLP